MTSVGSPACCLARVSTTGSLGVGARREAVAVLRLAHGIREALALGERDAHLDAVGGSDVALGLDVLPRRVEALRADEAEDVGLAAVLAHERRGEPETAARLEVGRHPEDRRGQQVDLVVDDEAPVAGVEQVEVRVGALPLRRQHLVGRDRDRPDLLARTGVLADLVLGQRRAPDQARPSTAAR